VVTTTRRYASESQPASGIVGIGTDRTGSDRDGWVTQGDHMANIQRRSNGAWRAR